MGNRKQSIKIKPQRGNDRMALSKLVLSFTIFVFAISLCLCDRDEDGKKSKSLLREKLGDLGLDSKRAKRYASATVTAGYQPSGSTHRITYEEWKRLEEVEEKREERRRHPGSATTRRSYQSTSHY